MKTIIRSIIGIIAFISLVPGMILLSLAMLFEER